MENLYFACPDCKIYTDAGYRWAHWKLVHPSLVTMRAPVDINRVLNAPAYWAPPQEGSDWLDHDIFPFVRQFLSDHQAHQILFWDDNDLPEDYLLHWLQIGYCPTYTARFFAETLRFRTWEEVERYNENYGPDGLPLPFNSDSDRDAFREAFELYAQKVQFERPHPTAAALESIRHWSDKTQLARFAADRHGYGDSNGGFGITYPSDLDEYDREVDGMHIPEGHVLAYGFWGETAGGYSVLVLENLYLTTLADELARMGLSQDAAIVLSLRRR